ncbi:MAG: hypothetical protein IJY90_03020 [Clostridia bacterium]|nr:hypothetical protein [Clostridia bacterium]
MLDKFNKKTDDYTTVDYGWQDELIAVALNYIEQYYPLAQGYTKSANVSKLERSLKELSQGYKALKTEYQGVVQLEVYENMTIYNGFVANYADEATRFSGKAYACALELSAYLSNKVKFDHSVGSDEVAQEAFEFYVDSRILEIFCDYHNFIMVNSKASLNSIPSGVLALQAKTISTQKSAEEIKQVKEYFDALAGERALVKNAFKHFSYYDYVKLYDADITAYEKVSPLARAYYKQIERYYFMTSYFTNISCIGKVCKFAANNIFA